MKKRNILLSAFWLFVLVCVLYAYFYEARALRTVHYEVVSADLPTAFDGFKIVYISDTHYGCVMSFDLMPRLRQLVEAEKPDLLLFGGDYALRTEESQRAAFEELAKLDAPYGKFGVLGNHDYKPSPEKTLEMMTNVGGIQSLSDRGLWLEKDGARIRMFGTEYLWDENHPLQFPRYELQRLKNEQFVLLLIHNPDDFMRFSRRERGKVDVALCGHTHGGQVTFFGLFTPVSVISHRDLQSGMVKWGNTAIITSNGVGTASLPLRFFAPPQVVAVTLRCKSENNSPERE